MHGHTNIKFELFWLMIFFSLLTYLPVYNEIDTCKMKDRLRLLYEPTLIIF